MPTVFMVGLRLRLRFIEHSLELPIQKTLAPVLPTIIGFSDTAQIEPGCISVVVVVLVDIEHLCAELAHLILALQKLFEVIEVLQVFEANVCCGECFFNDFVDLLGVVVVLG
jgi:hypothetical protein